MEEGACQALRAVIGSSGLSDAATSRFIALAKRLTAMLVFRSCFN